MRIVLLRHIVLNISCSMFHREIILLNSPSNVCVNTILMK